MDLDLDFENQEQPEYDEYLYRSSRTVHATGT